MEAWLIRIGDCRFIYELSGDLHIVTVITIGHRREVYE